MKHSLSLFLVLGLGVACSSKNSSQRHYGNEATARTHRSAIEREASRNKEEVSRDAAEVSDKYAASRKTADSQMGASEDDVTVTRKIRDRLTDMDELSARAQNITIVTRENNITLKGTVDKQVEIQKIMNVAREMASERSISNQLRVQK